MITGDMMRLLEDFHDIDLARMNHAHVVLLPKRDGVLTPSAFRLVSLLNYDMKIVCKTLASYLQAQIEDINIVDVDHSGFIAEWGISEKFIYATEMVQCCFKRRSPTLVLKLDFAKAFDSIDWLSLRKFLLDRGFPLLWSD
jgi:hypothetical protein